MYVRASSLELNYICIILLLSIGTVLKKQEEDHVQCEQKFK